MHVFHRTGHSALNGSLASSVMLVAALCTIAATSSEATESNVAPTAEMCAPFRQGPVVHQRLPVYFGAPSADPSSHKWIDVWYRPEYLTFPGTADMGRPDGLPNRNLLFTMQISNNQPFSDDLIHSVPIAEQRNVDIAFWGGQLSQSIERVLAVYARLPEKNLSGSFYRTGSTIGGFEKIVIPTSPEVDSSSFFAQFDPIGNITAVMICDNYGSVTIPRCRVVEKSGYWHRDLMINRTDRYLLSDIRKNTDLFEACLFLPGETNGTTESDATKQP